ncbi:DNA-binding response regulator [Echinicola pacifica]|uniref:DNA-binding response regulator n=1 Tax=Echinicola pacifica TaxID=346377 RepID=A0A918PJ83_9BACT|nr:response regulator transcription factor [Echinicola pacifica]GGZ12931.1 DNA-binding response regulator [Echinicola pacifica]
MKKILLVEDDSRVSAFIIKGLQEEGYEVTLAMDGRQGFDYVKSHSFDVLILDIMVPELNGIELCRLIREEGVSSPILFLTALGSAENVVTGLDAGADDYLSKPFKFIELLARIRTLLRRSGAGIMEDKPANVYRFSDLELNDDAKSVSRNGLKLNLTSTEYRLLLMLLKNPNRVLSRVDILEEVWGIDFDMGTNVVDVYINYLRKKMEKNGGERLIKTVIGMGYVLKVGE